MRIHYHLAVNNLVPFAFEWLLAIVAMQYGQQSAYQPPFCCACGVLVSDKEDLAMYNFFHEGRKVPMFWTSIYRAGMVLFLFSESCAFLPKINFPTAVVRERSEPAHCGKQSFHLSGVSRLYYHVDARSLVHGDLLRGRIFSVPWDKEEIVTERSHLFQRNKEFRDKRNAVYPVNFWDNRHRDLYPHGFPIHAHCWSMIRLIVGESAENELDLFLEVLHQRWKMEPQPFELGNCVRERFWFANHFERDANIELRAIWDPVNIPEIRSAIRRSRLRSFKRRNASSRCLSKLSLSLDVLLQILDYLQAADIENLLSATHWQVPDFYWRSRFPRKLIFEAEELISNKTENINWEFLYLEVEKLVRNERLLGLQNRQRIFRILEGTKELFLTRLLN